MTPAAAKRMLAQAEKSLARSAEKLEAAQKEHADCLKLIETLRGMAGASEVSSAPPTAPMDAFNPSGKARK